MDEYLISFFTQVKLHLTSAVQPVQVNCCARSVQRTPDSQKGACCAAPTSPGISGGAHSPGKTTNTVKCMNVNMCQTIKFNAFKTFQRYTVYR